MLMWLMLIFFIISMILMMINLFFSKKCWWDRLKMTSFECGFDILTSSRLPFSIHFFLLGLMFLVFDIEIIFLLPSLNLMLDLNFIDWMFLNFMILFILLLGLEYEKKEGTLKWFY